MSFRLRYDPLVGRLLRSWRLDDETLVDVYLRLEELRENPSSLLRRSEFPLDGMVYEFAFVDWQNRLCEHHFRFLVVYGQDEESLIVASGLYAPRYGY